MLKKMIKYDLMFGAKRYGSLLLLLCGTWLSGLLLSLIKNSYLNSIFIKMNIIVSVILFGAYAITGITLLHNALGGDEAYFNYTIPVKTSSLVLSKLVAVWLWGIAVIGSLFLVWISFDYMLFDSSLLNSLSDKMIKATVLICTAQFAIITCIVAFTVSLCNTPKMKSTNIGILLATVIAYGLTQAVGLIELGISLIIQHLSDADLVKAFFKSGLNSEQEFVFISKLSTVRGISGVIFMSLFFWLTVRTVEKKRSV